MNTIKYTTPGENLVPMKKKLVVSIEVILFQLCKLYKKYFVSE